MSNVVINKFQTLFSHTFRNLYYLNNLNKEMNKLSVSVTVLIVVAILCDGIVSRPMSMNKRSGLTSRVLFDELRKVVLKDNNQPGMMNKRRAMSSAMDEFMRQKDAGDDDDEDVDDDDDDNVNDNDNYDGYYNGLEQLDMIDDDLPYVF